jgi:hypothetical protein
LLEEEGRGVAEVGCCEEGGELEGVGGMQWEGREEELSM